MIRRRGPGLAEEEATHQAIQAPSKPADWDTERYARDAAFVPALGHGVLDWLGAKPGERILDLGCGDGTLTAELAAAGAGLKVVGVDNSPSQIAAAQARGLDARLMEADALTFDAEFDAVFSNAALHWMKDSDAVLGGVARALRPGGRLVAEMGGKGNVDTILTAILAALDARAIDGRPATPWLFPDAEHYGAALKRAGLRVLRMEHFARPTDLDCSMTDWLEIFAPAFAALVPEAERGALFDDVSERLEPHLFDRSSGRWWVDYVRLRFKAVKA